MRRSAGILTLTACAIRASAFLLPPGFTIASGHRLDPAALLGAGLAKSRALTLQCSECAFPPPKAEITEEAEGDVFRIQGGANSVLVNFSIAEDGKSLEFNGNTIYPLDSVVDVFSKAYVKQVPDSATLEEIKTSESKYTPLEVTGSGVVVQQEEMATPAGDVLIPIKYTIFGLEGQPVSIDEVQIKLLKTTAGDLYIMLVGTLGRLPPRPDDSILPHAGHIDMLFPPPPSHQKTDEDCKVLPPALCKLRNMLEAKISGMKKHGGMRRPCPGMMNMKDGKSRHHHDSKPGRLPPGLFGINPTDAPPSPHGRPHHHRPHHGHHQHSFFENFSRGFAAVLIPTLAGIAVGMMVSLLGLVLGRVIGYLWIKLYRGGRKGYASVALDESSAEAVDGEKAFVEQGVVEGGLPAYDGPPAYDEVAVKADK
ncbi:unnamed protein product [Zymoseptoria tritici ST99CH_3D7]|uniref:DUF7728 domain-containing protein n=1 Tax=Zymoseptoria tritici (strain ST99CH_3D7) TaxID=1276538 RepID=A0A1X7RMY9_ZYMT9|nr:unnamed protein product [Zymoseptoria tritici ST99CH_3D7]